MASRRRTGSLPNASNRAEARTHFYERRIHEKRQTIQHSDLKTGFRSDTPKKVTRLVLESVETLRENGILADTYRSNGKRWISLKRADSADFPPVKIIGTIDPAGAPSACTAP